MEHSLTIWRVSIFIIKKHQLHGDTLAIKAHLFLILKY